MRGVKMAWRYALFIIILGSFGLPSLGLNSKSSFLSFSKAFQLSAQEADAEDTEEDEDEGEADLENETSMTETSMEETKSSGGGEGSFFKELHHNLQKQGSSGEKSPSLARKKSPSASKVLTEVEGEEEDSSSQSSPSANNHKQNQLGGLFERVLDKALTAGTKKIEENMKKDSEPEDILDDSEDDLDLDEEAL